MRYSRLTWLIPFVPKSNSGSETVKSSVVTNLDIVKFEIVRDFLDHLRCATKAKTDHFERNLLARPGFEVCSIG